MFLIVGLGNPGKDYEGTRHNVGFMLADRLAGQHGMRFEKCRGLATGGWGGRGRQEAVFARGVIAGAEVVVLKPLTFMNLSGDVVLKYKESFSLDMASIIVAYDDCDLPLGRLRVRKKGGSGGHRGMASIIRRLDSEDFPRVRLGIGRPAVEADMADFVLSPFNKHEAVEVESMLDAAVKAIETFVSEGVDSAMNRFNSSN